MAPKDPRQPISDNSLEALLVELLPPQSADDSADPTGPFPLSASHYPEALLNELLSNPSMSTHCACPSSSRLSQHHFGYSQ